MVKSKHIGFLKENDVVNFLIDEGYKIKVRNYYCKMGEIDIIAIDREYLVFIEVKYRKSTNIISPREAVDYRKQQKICKTVGHYMFKEQISDNCPIRFDVAEVTDEKINIIKNAFMFCY